MKVFINLFFVVLFFGSIVSCGKGNKKRANKNEIVLAMRIYPKTFNSYNGGDWYTSQITGVIWESMLSSDENTYEITPLLAKKWSIGKDKKTYYFTINEKAYFSDNVPVTADDVVFTFKTIYDPLKAPLAQSSRSYLGKMETIKKISRYKVMIKMKEVHFDHLRMLGGVSILPKHIYSKGDFKSDFDTFVSGSGEYVLLKNNRATKRNVILEKNPNWWGKGIVPSSEKYNQFNRIKYNIIKENNKIYLSFKKKNINFTGISSEVINLYRKDKKLNKDKNFTQVERENNFPNGWSGVALNTKRVPLNEKKFRQALQLCLNRESINKKIYNGLNRSVASPISIGSPYSAKPKVIGYNPELAKKYLNEIGYTNIDKDGVLYKLNDTGEKIKAEITIFFSGERHEKWLTVFKEQAKAVGIGVKVQKKEWQLLTKDMNERNYQALCVGWGGGGVYPGGIRQIFSAKAARTPKSSNFTQLENERIDELLDLAEKEQNDKKRYAYFHQIESIIIDEQPYIFTFQAKNHIYAYWNDELVSNEWLNYTGVIYKIWARWKPKQD